MECAARAGGQDVRAPAQKLSFSPNCSCLGSNAAVGWPKVIKGVVPLPKVLFGTPKFARLKRLKPSAIRSNLTRSVIAKRRFKRRSKDAKSKPRPVFRPTPTGRSLLFVSKFRSLPSSTLKGRREAY